VLLTDADRSRWDADATAEAVALLERTLRRGHPGPFQVRAAISCLHSLAADVDSTDWPQVVQLYRILEEMSPTVAVRVNRAVAEAQVHGAAAGLALLDAVVDTPEAQRWHLYHAARADLLRRTGDTDASAVALATARDLASNPTDRVLLDRRLATLDGAP
jgi:RNA polymerase sigma-70 factor (ECF subfamily)